ncbi:MAG: class I SAM-dependent methyltransferase [Candidatus Solibacter usitatus]|nr:class I SAM-dependent methyltransferase [Candidatus Solibacter usitatus]
MRFLICLLLAALAFAQAPKNAGARWDSIYLNPDAKVPVNPSALVLETTANLKPGAALDVGMGNGRNAVYLARKGWKVTGVDLSKAAVKQAQAEAAKLKVELETTAGDAEKMDLGRGKYDLIVCMYVHPLPLRGSRKLIDALKPGGTLIVEGHQSDYPNNQLAHTFDKLRIVRYEDRVMQSEWPATADGRAPVVRLVARKE